MHKRLLITAAVSGGLSVALGAFGAHTLKQYLDPQLLTTFETGVRYQFYHVFAIALAGILYQSYPDRKIILAGNLFLLGTCLFSGSLYLLSISGIRWLGVITPLGGLAFIAGWVLLVRAIGASRPG